jgi:hypothetical protein
MKKLVLGALSLMAAVATAHADQCESWTHAAYPVSMSACSYDNGGSGYVIMTNNGSSTANICWTVVYNDGRSKYSCHSAMGSGESSSSSCFSCGSKNGGARHILLQKYQEVN